MSEEKTFHEDIEFMKKLYKWKEKSGIDFNSFKFISQETAILITVLLDGRGTDYNELMNIIDDGILYVLKLVHDKALISFLK